MAVCVDYQPVYFRTKSRSSAASWQVLIASCLLAVLLTRVWLRSETTELGYHLSDLRKETIELDLVRRELTMQLSVLTRPDSLAERGKRELGFAELKSSQLRSVRY